MIKFNSITKGETHQICKMCIHLYTRNGERVLQLHPNGTAEELDGTRMPIGEEKRQEFVKDALGKKFYKQYHKCGISESDKEVFNKWYSKMIQFYKVARTVEKIKALEK